MIDRHWNEVRELGEKIGYGKLMTVASILWASKLIDAGLPDNGAFYPTGLFNMKDSTTTKDQVEYRKAWLEFYRKNIVYKE
jgi:hypothetical protein